MIYPLLYKRSTTGKISTWCVETKDNCFRTISGFTDGQKAASEWTCCEGKSYNSSNEQATKQAEALHRKRLETCYWEDIKKIDTPVYFKPMLAHKLEDYIDELVYPIFSQPKLDGVRCPTREDGMWTRNGKKIISAPHIRQSVGKLFNEIPELVLDGELYADKLSADFNMIISCVKKTKPTFEDLLTSRNNIEYHVYDCGSHPGNFLDRYTFLQNLNLEQYGYIKLVPINICYNADDIAKYYDEYMKMGYEGQMIRLNKPYENKRSKSLLKDKGWMDEEFEIMGYVEGKGNLSGKLGKLKFITNNGVTFDSAVNGGWEYITELWNKRDSLIGKQATVKYFGYTPDGSLRFPKVINIAREDWE